MAVFHAKLIFPACSLLNMARLDAITDLRRFHDLRCNGKTLRFWNAVCPTSHALVLQRRVRIAVYTEEPQQSVPINAPGGGLTRRKALVSAFANTFLAGCVRCQSARSAFFRMYPYLDRSNFEGVRRRLIFTSNCHLGRHGCGETCLIAHLLYIWT